MSEKFDVMGVFDNGGLTIDRYTIWLMSESGDESFVVSSSSNPTHPQGVWSADDNGYIDVDEIGKEGNEHIGEEIDWDMLPKNVQKTVSSYFELDYYY